MLRRKEARAPRTRESLSEKQNSRIARLHWLFRNQGRDRNITAVKDANGDHAAIRTCGRARISVSRALSESSRRARPRGPRPGPYPGLTHTVHGGCLYHTSIYGHMGGWDIGEGPRAGRRTGRGTQKTQGAWRICSRLYHGLLQRWKRRKRAICAFVSSCGCCCVLRRLVCFMTTHCDIDIPRGSNSDRQLHAMKSVPLLEPEKAQKQQKT